MTACAKPCAAIYIARGVRAEPDQVMIANGAQHVLYLAARALLRPGDVAWVENPGCQGARAAFQAAGAHWVPVPVDRDGLCWTTSPAPKVPRLIHVTPSHQYPSGATMSIGRRQVLVAYAGEHGSYVVEDDSDSECRFDGYPLRALQGLDPAERVIYVGAFSKVLAPTWRLGYAVLPRELIRALRTWRAATDRGSPHFLPEAFAPFVAEGHLERHVARWRRRYRARRDALAAALTKLPGTVLDPAPAGLHLRLGRPDATDDRAVARAAGRAGVAAEALAAYSIQPRCAKAWARAMRPSSRPRWPGRPRTWPRCWLRPPAMLRGAAITCRAARRAALPARSPRRPTSPPSRHPPAGLRPPRR